MGERQVEATTRYVSGSMGPVPLGGQLGTGRVAQRRPLRILAPLFAAALLAASCSGEDSAVVESDSGTGTTLVAVEEAVTTEPVSSAPPATTPVTAEAAAGADAAAPAGPDADDPVLDFAEVVAAVDAGVEELDLNGAGLVIVERDQGIVFEHYTGEFSADRISLIASSSKMITAGVLMNLDDQGLLDVEAPVADLVEWGSANPDITPIQLISNSSGLIGLTPESPYLCQYLFTGTIQDCGEFIFTMTDDDADVIAPDTEFRYGGGQWQVAGAVAEIAAGKSWAELIEEIYVEPCGLNTLAYNNHYTQIVGDNGPFGYPTPFNSDPSLLEESQNPNMEGGAYVTAPDYAQLLMMHLNEGRCGDNQVLSPEAVELMHSDRIGTVYGADTNGGLEGYGLGWWVDRDEPGHISDGGAFGSYPWLDLELGYGVYFVIEQTNLASRGITEVIQPLIHDQFAAQG